MYKRQEIQGHEIYPMSKTKLLTTQTRHRILPPTIYPLELFLHIGAQLNLVPQDLTNLIFQGHFFTFTVLRMNILQLLPLQDRCMSYQL